VAVAQGTAWRKGGKLTSTALGAEVPHDGTDRVVGGAESLGQLVEGPPVDEEGAEDLVAAMQDLIGFEEEATAGDVIHVRISGVRRVNSQRDQDTEGRSDGHQVQGGAWVEGRRDGISRLRTPIHREYGVSRSLIWEGRTIGWRSEITPQEYAELPRFLREIAIFDLRD
jgi:hypothetical protein